MDITTLAKDVALFLTPFLPHLLKAGEKAAEETGKKLGGVIRVIRVPNQETR